MLKPQIIFKNNTTDYRTYAWVFLLAVFARCVFLIFIDTPVLFFKYPFFAEKLIAGKSLGERIVDLSPLYLYLLALFHKLTGADWTWVKLFQSFIGALNALLLLKLGSRTMGKTPALIATLIFALYGNMIILESTLEPTVFVLFFNMLAVYFLLDATDHTGVINNKKIIMTGLFTGLSIITKPSFLLFLPLGTFWMIFFLPHPALKTKWRTLLLFNSIALLVVLPVTIRNYVQLNDFVLVTADAGKVFYHGNAKKATALEWTGLPDEGFIEETMDEPDAAHVLFRKTAFRIAGRKLLPSEASTFWVEKTLDDILIDPGRYLKRELKKLAFFFCDYETHYIASSYKEYKDILRFPFIRFGIIAAMGILGMILSLNEFRHQALIYGVIALYVVSGMIFIVQSRYRVPAIPYLALFAGTALHKMAGLLSTKKFRRAAICILLGIFFFFASTYLFKTEIEKSDNWQLSTKIHYQMGGRPLFNRGRFQEAIKELDICISMTPEFSPAYNLRGKSYAMMGNYKEALENFNRVLSLSPGSVEGYKNIGFIHLLQGNAALGRTFLQKAISIAPGDKKIRASLEEIEPAGSTLFQTPFPAPP
jgi:4-amino-4-deoxy-L-arabinose transferase-like glycosyltransferase